MVVTVNTGAMEPMLRPFVEPTHAPLPATPQQRLVLGLNGSTVAPLGTTRAYSNGRQRGSLYQIKCCPYEAMCLIIVLLKPKDAIVA
jgi:hypothetical protein